MFFNDLHLLMQNLDSDVMKIFTKEGAMNGHDATVVCEGTKILSILVYALEAADSEFNWSVCLL